MHNWDWVSVWVEFSSVLVELSLGLESSNSIRFMYHPQPPTPFYFSFVSRRPTPNARRFSQINWQTLQILFVSVSAAYNYSSHSNRNNNNGHLWNCHCLAYLVTKRFWLLAPVFVFFMRHNNLCVGPIFSCHFSGLNCMADLQIPLVYHIPYTIYHIPYPIVQR